MDTFLPSDGGFNFSENGGCKVTDYRSKFLASQINVRGLFFITSPYDEAKVQA